MNRILILGGSHRDIPLIGACKDLGYYVITLANLDGYIGHHYSDKYYKIDFNDGEAVKEIIRKEGVSYIIPGCGEASYLKTVELCEELRIGNLDSFETAKIVHNKWLFKEFCLSNGISTPAGVFYEDGVGVNLRFPVLVKPTNLSGGRGVRVVNDETGMIRAIEEAQKYSREIFIEEFVQGDLMACSVILQNNKVSYIFTGLDVSYENKYLISTAFPYELSDKATRKVISDIETISSGLGLCDGMFHLQVILRSDVPYIIDVTRRIPGDLFPFLIEECDGIEYSRAVVKLYTTGVLDRELESKFTSPKCVVRHVTMSDKSGVYKGVSIDEEISKNMIYRLDLVSPGSEIVDYLTTQISILLFYYDADRLDVNFNRLISVDVE